MCHGVAVAWTLPSDPKLWRCKLLDLNASNDLKTHNTYTLHNETSQDEKWKSNKCTSCAHALRMRQIKRCKTPPLISHIRRRHAGLKKCKLVSTLLNIFCRRAHNRLNAPRAANNQRRIVCAMRKSAAPEEYTCKYDSGKLGAAAHSQSRLLSDCASGEQGGCIVCCAAVWASGGAEVPRVHLRPTGILRRGARMRLRCEQREPGISARARNRPAANIQPCQEHFSRYPCASARSLSRQ